jgi:hypothetical protein
MPLLVTVLCIAKLLLPLVVRQLLRPLVGAFAQVHRGAPP